jgi:hypothetical protein
MSRSFVLFVDSVGRSQSARLTINALGRSSPNQIRLKSPNLGQCDNAPGACTVEPTLLPRTSVSGTLAIEHRR